MKVLEDVEVQMCLPASNWYPPAGDVVAFRSPEADYDGVNG